jgi:hypothetical protein
LGSVTPDYVPYDHLGGDHDGDVGPEGAIRPVAVFRGVESVVFVKRSYFPHS